MKQPLTFLIVAFLLIPLFSTAQKKKYRVKTFSGQQIMLAPHSKIGGEGLFGTRTTIRYKSRFRYQRLFFRSLGKDYLVNFNQAAKAEYEWDNRRIDEIRRIYYYGVEHGAKPHRIPHGQIFYSKDSATVIVEIDYNHLPASLDDYANELAESLYRTLSIGDKWAPGTAQDLVEKIFDRLPLPQATTWKRYGAIHNDQLSFLFLHPKIVLQVDTITRTSAGFNWQFNLIGRNLITIYRDASGNIRQLPFVSFDVKQMPNNKITDAGDVIHQASAGDIQLSEGTKQLNYIAFFQHYLKRNNSQSSNPPGTATQNDSLKATSVLMHFSDVPSVLDCANQDRCLELNPNIIKSSFGKRNLIIPGFIIFLNNQPVYVPFQTTLAELKQWFGLPLKLKWTRNMGRRNCPLVLFNDNTSLLPADHINF